jgi:hypothetical protein
MSDIAYRCHHCGSTHEAESIRQNLYLNQRPIATYASSGRWGVVDLSEFFRRRRMTQGIGKALWPKVRHYSRRS